MILVPIERHTVLYFSLGSPSILRSAYKKSARLSLTEEEVKILELMAQAEYREEPDSELPVAPRSLWGPE